MKKQQDLTRGNILKVFCFFALPLFFSSLFQQLYGTVDLLFVGNFLGKQDAAAVGSSSIILTCLIGMFTGIAVGTGVITAQYRGAKDSQKIQLCIQNAFVFGMLGGIVLTLAGQILAGSALKLLNTPRELMEHALIYLRLYLLAVIPMILYNVSAGILRALGDSRTPFYILALGGILNVIMDALFIAVLGWGVRGAALATLVSQTFTAVLGFAAVAGTQKLLNQKWNIDGKMVWKIIVVGVPLGLQSTVITLSNAVVQFHINGFGEDAVAAFAVYFQAENLIYLPIMAFGQAMVTFTGQNYGANQKKRIRSGTVQCSLLAAGVTAGVSALVLAGGRSILSLFCDDPPVVEVGLRIIKVSFPFYFLYALLEVVGSVIRGIGKTVQSMVIIICNLCVIRIVLLGLLVSRMQTVEAVASAYPFTWFLTTAAFVGYYRVCDRKYLQDT